MLNKERLKEIEERAGRASRGPWYGDGMGVFNDDRELLDYCLKEDVAFIAHARQDVPDLIAEVRRLQERWDKMKSLANNEANHDNDDISEWDVLLNTMQDIEDGTYDA